MTRGALIGSIVFIGGLLVATGACSGGDSNPSGGGDGGGDDATVDEGGGSGAEGGSSLDSGKDANFGTAGCGRDTTKCANGQPCAGPPDCMSGICRANKCAAPDMTMDASSTETDVGCGGPNAPACGDGKKCKVADDCTSEVCTMGICQAPTCTDGILNGTETAKDCGGGMCPLCADGSTCKMGMIDCKSGICTGNICQTSTCSDGIKNGTETDIDCGGMCPGKCATGATCSGNTDCASDICNGTKKCAAPGPTDGVQNGGETDTDCGGALQADGTMNPMADGAPKCAVGKKCVIHYDCTTDGCDYTGHCAIAPSCAPHYGGDTCGAGETGTGAANGENHESCCSSIPLLGSTVKVDKYEITAGRMREFLTRVNNNVYGWYQTWKTTATPAQIAAVGIRAADEQYLPQDVDKPFLPAMKWNDCEAPGGCPPGAVTQQTGRTAGVYDHLGNTVFFADSPSDFQGCYVGAGEYQDGHPTYWWDDSTQANQWGAGPRGFTQQQLDEKSLNCVTQIMLAAFCAWDGGRLPTYAELANASSGANSAWGASTYPWGNTPTPNDTFITDGVAPSVVAVHDNLNGTQGPSPGVYDVLMPINDGTGNANLLAPTQNTTNWNPFYPFLPTGLRYYWPQMKVGNCQDTTAGTTYVSTCVNLPPGKTCPTNCGWGQNDEAYEIAAPGRFINDKRKNPNAGAPGGALDGWFDVAANMMEATSDGTNTDGANHDSTPTKYWVGGSFEGHGVARSNFQFSILTKYGKMGGRCAR
jgi:hypothetical protein